MKHTLLTLAVFFTATGLTLGQQPASTPATPAAPDFVPEDPVTDATPPTFNPDRVWASAEYLLWWFKHERMPALVGSVPASDVQAGTEIPPEDIVPVIGGQGVNFDSFSGGRFMAGVWLDSEGQLGLDGGGFLFGQRRLAFNASTAGDPVIGALFVDPGSGLLTIITPVDPTSATESASAAATERLWSAEGNVRFRTVCFGDSSFDLLAGFRYLDLSTSIDYNSEIDFASGDTRVFTNTFGARTQFYGAQIGAAFDIRAGAWTLDVIGKVALGTVHESVEIDGQTTDTFADGTVQTFPGGVLAQPSNMGRFTRSEFSAVPEVTANLGYQLTRYLRAFVGVNWLEVTQATRAGGVIDTQVNPSSIHGLIVGNPETSNRPTFQFPDSDFWAIGINFGVQLQF